MFSLSGKLCFYGAAVLLTCSTMGSATVITAFATNNLTMTDVSPRVVRTVDSLHSAWPTPAAIPYRLDFRYSTADQTAIQTAMTQISTDMGQCIKFVPYNNATDSAKSHLYIGPLTTPNNNPASGVLFTTCFSSPGLVIAAGVQGQKLGLVNGTDGCLSSPREIMKYLVNALGLRDEWRRPDRGTFITVNPQNVKTTLGVTGAEITRIYGLGQTGGSATVPAGQTVDIMGTSFDFNSITMPASTKYTNGQALYTVNPGQNINVIQNGVSTNVPATVGTLARLSRDDCRGLQSIYSSLGCSTIICQDPYNPSATPLPALTPVVGNAATGSVTGIVGPAIAGGGVSGGPVEPVGGAGGAGI